MNGFWGGLGDAESAAIAASGGANALYFARRATAGPAARRVAAGVLAGLFAGVGMEGASHLGGPAQEAVEVVQRAPLLFATLAANALVALGARR